MKIILPLPPPENERLIFAKNLGRFILSKKYREYKLHAQQLLKAISGITMIIPTFENQLIIEITVFLSDKRRDGHGCLKPLMDVLQGVVYDSDKWVVPSFNKFNIDKDNPRVIICL